MAFAFAVQALLELNANLVSSHFQNAYFYIERNLTNQNYLCYFFIVSGCNIGGALGCLNGGTCLSNGNCQCPIGFNGTNCASGRFFRFFFTIFFNLQSFLTL
jgi:hypothetical protein